MVSVINNIMSNIGASKNKGGADHLSYIWLMSLATAQQFATIGWGTQQRIASHTPLSICLTMLIRW